MGKCYLCEVEVRESVWGYWCNSCRKIKNIGNCYGFDKVLDILNKCCLRNEEQIDRKIKIHKGDLKTIEESEEAKEYYLRRPKDKNKKDNQK